MAELQLSIAVEREEIAFMVLSRLREQAATASALCVLQLTDPLRKPVAVLPYFAAQVAWEGIQGNPNYWDPEDQATLDVMLSQVDAYIATNEKYYGWCDHMIRIYTKQAAKGYVSLELSCTTERIQRTLATVNKEFTVLLEIQQALLALKTP